MTTFIRLCGGETGVGTTRDECPHRLHDFPLPDGYGTAANWTSDHAHRLNRIIQGDTE